LWILIPSSLAVLLIISLLLHRNPPH
jgi:hypothetical protein